MDEVESVNVNSVTGLATVELNSEENINEIPHKIEKAGYEVPMQTVKIDITGMSCEACAARITKLLNKIDRKSVV